MATIISDPFCILPKDYKKYDKIMIIWICCFPYDNTIIHHPVSFNFIHTTNLKMAKVEIRHIGTQFANIDTIYTLSNYSVSFKWINRFLSHAKQIYVIQNDKDVNTNLQFALLKKFPYYKKTEIGYIFMKKCL